MKYSLSPTLLALTTITLMVLTAGSSGTKGLQSVSVEAHVPDNVPSFKIYGLGNLLQILNSASDYTNATFDVITFDSWSQTTTDQGVVIDGKVTIANDQGTNITGLINGSWDPVNNKLVFNATKYEVETEEGEQETPNDVPAGYVGVDIEVAKNDPAISAAFNWGTQALIRAGERQNKIPTSNYTVTEWSSAAYRNKSNGVYYKFVAELLGENEVHVETNITVFYWYSNQSYLLAGYYYKATYIPAGSLPNNFTDNNTVVIPPYVPAGYTFIPQTELDNNTQAQAALTWGVDAIIQKAINQYKLPVASPQYNITNVIAAAYKNTGFGVNYIFWLNLTNALKYKVDANITVAYRTSNQSYRLTGYSYHSYGYPSGAIVIPQTNATANISVNATDNTGSSNVTVPDNTTVVVPDNSTVVDNTTVVIPDNSTSVDNSTVVVPPVNETESVNNSTTNVTAPTNTTTPLNQTTDDGYTILTPEQYANDSIAQAALQVGIDSLVQKAISQNKIPAANPTYTVSNLVQAAYKKGAIGTSYKFQVNLTNVDNVKIDANLSVFYRYSTKAYTLNGYNFRSYGFKNSALGNGNNGNKNNSNNTNVTAPTANTTVAANSTVVDASASTNSGSR